MADSSDCRKQSSTDTKTMRIRISKRPGVQSLFNDKGIQQEQKTAENVPVLMTGSSSVDPWERYLSRWYAVEEIAMMRSYFDDILLYVREEVTVQAWNTDGKAGRQMILSMEDNRLQFEPKSITLRTSPCEKDSNLLLARSHEVTSRASEVLVLSSQKVEAIAYTRDFALVKKIADQHTSFGWISCHYIGGDPGSLVEGQIVEFDNDDPWLERWWLGCTAEVADLYKQLVWKRKDMRVLYFNCTYEEIEERFQQSIMKQVKDLETTLQHIPKGSQQHAQLERIKGMIKPSSKYVYCCIQIEDCHAQLFKDWERLVQYTAMKRMAVVKSRHMEQRTGLHISLFYLCVEGFSATINGEIKLYPLKTILEKEIDSLLSTSSEDLVKPRIVRASVEAMKQEGELHWNGYDIINFELYELLEMAEDGLLKSLHDENSSGDTDPVQASKQRYRYLHDRDTKRLREVDKLKQEANELRHQFSYWWRQSGSCVYLRNTKGLQAFDEITRLYLYLIVDHLKYHFHLDHFREHYALSRFLKCEQLHVSDAGPWYYTLKNIE